jgi:hypothetical protein
MIIRTDSTIVYELGVSFDCFQALKNECFCLRVENPEEAIVPRSSRERAKALRSRDLSPP